ncbi:MAG: gamma-glutamyl-gamma-aminobutyrate hydrolase family protein [Rhodococcus sp. (in: high G+C Gram-positive bacteria)]
MSETNSRAVVLVHDRDPALGYRNIGTFIPELQQRGFQLQVHSFDYASASTPPPLGDAAMVVVMGSPDAAYGLNPWVGPETTYLERAIGLDVPILGVCFGGQLLAQILGGTVTKSDWPEYGMTDIESDCPELVGSGPWMQFHVDTFDSWAHAWARDGVEHDRQLVAAIREDLEAGERAARARCSALLDAWIGRQSR